MAEQQETPTKKSRHLQEKSSEQPSAEKPQSPRPTEQDLESTDSQELPDVPWPAP